MSETLDDLIGQSLQRPVGPQIQELAREVLRLIPEAAAILVYGSSLRGVSAGDTLIDFYVLVRRDRDGGGRLLARCGQAILPPNVYYLEVAHDGKTLRAKYAVVSLGAFTRAMGPRVRNPYFWARFAQPCALAYAAGADERAQVIAALSLAHRTLYGHAKALPGPAASRWQRVFRETYRTELRAEGPERAAALIGAHASYYARAEALLADAPALPARWWLRRIQGKLLSVLRLVKAAFTFAGGADYLAWKIERHSGEKLALSDWQRRHPILAGISLLPRLIRRGAVK